MFFVKDNHEGRRVVRQWKVNGDNKVVLFEPEWNWVGKIFENVNPILVEVVETTVDRRGNDLYHVPFELLVHVMGTDGWVLHVEDEA